MSRLRRRMWPTLVTIFVKIGLVFHPKTRSRGESVEDHRQACRRGEDVDDLILMIVSFDSSSSIHQLARGWAQTCHLYCHSCPRRNVGSIDKD